jgi:hypothetical protein
MLNETQNSIKGESMDCICIVRDYLVFWEPW